jgi:predicted nucleic acid-binding protein
MNAAERFLDTSVLLYLLSADQAKADRAERELLAGGIVSVQVLNEFASVSLGKLGMSITETREVLATVRAVCRVVPVTEEVHDAGMRLAETLGASVYDAMIVASALLAGCRTLVTEDLQHGRIVDGRLRIHDPFR